MKVTYVKYTLAFFLSIFFFVANAQNAHNGHEYVDLGLPSGIRWATTNIGAPINYRSGSHYAWGELEPKTNYDYSTNKFADKANGRGYIKYNRRDQLSKLRPEDDVAHVRWGGKWRIPTSEECEELAKCCNWQSIVISGTNAIKVTGPNGQSIIFPLNGNYWGTNLVHAGKFGTIWCSDRLTSGSNQQLGFYWEKSGKCSALIGNDSGLIGMNVRAVFKE